MPRHQPWRTDTAENTLNVYILPPLPELTLPCLLPITDPTLNDMVFTHTSSLTIPRSFHTSMFLVDGTAGLDYEKLEHVGDAILEAVAVTLAHELYPNLRQGAAAIVRDKLVCNATLAQISVAYGLHLRLKSPPALRHTLKRNEKVQASIFEAYIAGLYYSFLGELPDVSIAVTPKLDTSYTNASVKSDPLSASVLSSNDPDKYAEPSPTEGWDIKSIKSSASAEVVLFENTALLQNEMTNLTDRDEGAPSVLNPFDTERALLAAIDMDDNDVFTDESTVEDEQPSLPQSQSHRSPTQDTSSSFTIMPKRTRGEAFDHVFTWLAQVLEPITHFVIVSLGVEERRLNAIKPPPLAPFQAPPEWAAEDKKARGGKATLNTCPKIAAVGLPTYREEQCTHLGSMSTAPWRAVCVAKDVEGNEWRAEAMRLTKKAACNMAAWKICIAMGLIDKED